MNENDYNNQLNDPYNINNINNNYIDGQSFSSIETPSERQRREEIRDKKEAEMLKEA